MGSQAELKAGANKNKRNTEMEAYIDHLRRWGHSKGKVYILFGRFKAHFMRNILARVPHRDKIREAEKINQIWLQPDRSSAEKLAGLIIEEYKKKYPEDLSWLKEKQEESLQFYSFPDA